MVFGCVVVSHGDCWIGSMMLCDDDMVVAVVREQPLVLSCSLLVPW